MKLFLVLLGVTVVLAVLAAAAKGRRGASNANAPVTSLVSKPALMDKWEAELYERLVVALRASHVFPQVAMSAFLKEAKRRNGGRNSFAQKYVDFLVCERGTLKPLYVIELDGRSHGSAKAKEKDAKRDALLTSAGIPIRRYTSSKVDFAIILRDHLEIVGPARLVVVDAVASTEQAVSSNIGSH
ncbi:DUF2726 domain-containing protein [Ralstonia nicotianae]